jgi:hypothetical protein
MFTLTRNLLTLALVAGLLGIAASAGAETRKVCGYIKFLDDRIGCDGCGNAENLPGRIDPCNGPGTDYYAGKIKMELWDHDTWGSDEYIGTWYLPWHGGFCINFEWEDADYSKGEYDPDLYLKYTSWNWGYYDTIQVRLNDPSEFGLADAKPPEIEWSDNRVNNCQNGSTCWFSSVNYASQTSGSLNQSLFMVGDTGSHTYTAFHDHGEDAALDTVTLNFKGTAGTSAYSPGSQTIGIHNDDDTSPWTPAHEIGHAYHDQLMGMNGFGTFSYCGYGTPAPCGHSLTSQEYDKAATMEGWANYVAARSWWDPQDEDSCPCVYGWDVHDNTPPNAADADDNRGIELLVARGFWDLDDVTEDSSVAPCTLRWDNIDLDSVTDIAHVWSLVPPGSANRQGQEDDFDGANLWDYWYVGHYGNGFFDDPTEVWTTLVDMHCQYGMDWG